MSPKTYSAVPYAALQYHADVRIVDRHGTMAMLSE